MACKRTCAAGLIASVVLATAAGPPAGVSQPRWAAEPMPRSVTGDSLLVAKRVDLGTLGGAGAEPRAVSDGVVVGSAETASRRWHAFAYDLDAPAPRMVDLGTLGGGRSDATDISGRLVVGTSEADGQRGHLFVYDLKAPDPKMVDLDVGRAVQAGPFVDGDVVTWAMRGPSSARQAFAYDLGAGNPHPVSLGSLGGGESVPLDIRAGVIVGMAQSGSNPHAFAYDLNAPDPHMMDLDRVHDWSTARAVDANLVVGQVDLEERGGRPFVADLSSAEPTLRALPTLNRYEAEWASAEDIDGHVVVGSTDTRTSYSRPIAYDLDAMRRPINLGTLGGRGTAGEATSIDFPYAVGWSFAADDRNHVFAYDFGATTPRMTDLGPPGRSESAVRAIDGNVAVGVTFSPRTGDRVRAVAWRLRRSTGPVLELARTVFTASEDRRFANVIVKRRGDISRRVQVRYKVAEPHMWGFRAVAGRDFKPILGALRFLPGQTTKNIKVPIVDDTVAEGPERFAVYLSRPVDAALGTPQVARVVIDASDGGPR